MFKIPKTFSTERYIKKNTDLSETIIFFIWYTEVFAHIFFFFDMKRLIYKGQISITIQ